MLFLIDRVHGGIVSCLVGGEHVSMTQYTHCMRIDLSHTLGFHIFLSQY
jgi:hypothetical protein